MESLIGKEVYCNDVPLACLDHANEHRRAGILREVCEENTDYPFQVEIPEGEVSGFVCIIPKKNEPKPEHTSFKSVEEFVESYVEAKGGVKTDSFEDKLLQCGMWIKWYNSGRETFNDYVIAWTHVIRPYRRTRTDEKCE